MAGKLACHVHFVAIVHGEFAEKLILHALGEDALDALVELLHDITLLSLGQILKLHRLSALLHVSLSE